MFGCGFTAELIEVHCACGSGVLFEEELYPSFDMTGVGFCSGSPECRVAIVQFELARLAQEAQNTGQEAAGMAAVVGRLLANCDVTATANAADASGFIADGSSGAGQDSGNADGAVVATTPTVSCGESCPASVLATLGDHDAFCGAHACTTRRPLVEFVHMFVPMFTSPPQLEPFSTLSFSLSTLSLSASPVQRWIPRSQAA